MMFRAFVFRRSYLVCLSRSRKIVLEHGPADTERRIQQSVRRHVKPRYAHAYILTHWTYANATAIIRSHFPLCSFPLHCLFRVFRPFTPLPIDYPHYIYFAFFARGAWSERMLGYSPRLPVVAPPDGFSLNLTLQHCSKNCDAISISKYISHF
jgi:hypothetical protein